MEFERVSFGHRALVERYMGRYGENSCQHSFPAMYCLGEKYGDAVCERAGWLFTLRALRGDERHRAYLMPMGDGDLAQALALLTDDARSHGARLCFETVTAAARDRLEALCPGRFAAQEQRDMAEYSYDRERIAALSGPRLSTKRYEAGAFWRRLGGRADIAPITPADLDEIRAFQTDWVASKHADPSWVHLLHENETILLALAHYEALGLEGLVLRVDGAVRGFVYGCRLSPDCFDMMAEKADRELLGSYSVLNQEFAARCAVGCRLLNWEEDVGVSGLRQAKLSYKPDILLKKYTLSEVGPV